jgi:hypothetical protein
MAPGFCVADLLPRARGGGQLRMGLSRIQESEWLDPSPNRAARRAAFAAFPDGVQIMPEGEAAAAELASEMGAADLHEAACLHHEDLCVLTRREGEESHRLVAMAVAWPSDWVPADKIGLPLGQVHAPIHGYAQQLAQGVDHFMARLPVEEIYARSNWFVTPTGAMHWQGKPPATAFAHVKACNAGRTLFARTERQTLRRLPRTGAIVFTIGVYVQALEELPVTAIQWLADAASRIEAGERERRGIDHYLPALRGFAETSQGSRAA